MANTFETIIQELKRKVYHPVYFLSGEEPYYIDKVTNYIENNVLTENEKEFNQTILYGKEVDILTVLSHAKRYPMMSNYQVIIVKEAQEMRSLFSKSSSGSSAAENENPLLKYIKSPQSTSLLVFCYKYKNVDARTKLGKSISKSTVFLKSSKIYQDKIPGWISIFVKQNGYKIEDKACSMLSDFLGNDISKVSNEIEKLMINIDDGSEITPDLIEKYIGISKDFNIFELQDAIGTRNILKAQRIAKYFSDNPKASPFPVTATLLYSYFRRLMAFHSLNRKNARITREEKASKLGINPFFMRGVEIAANNYSLFEIVKIFSLLHTYDLKSKGIKNATTDTGELLRELVYKIMHPVTELV